jgi:hypothetical protein
MMIRPNSPLAFSLILGGLYKDRIFINERGYFTKSFIYTFKNGVDENIGNLIVR